MKQEYVVLQCEYRSDLCKEVTERLNDGWVCVGGVVISPDQYFYQAMIKTHYDVDELKRLFAPTWAYFNKD